MARPRHVPIVAASRTWSSSIADGPRSPARLPRLLGMSLPAAGVAPMGTGAELAGSRRTARASHRASGRCCRYRAHIRAHLLALRTRIRATPQLPPPRTTHAHQTASPPPRRDTACAIFLRADGEPLDGAACSLGRARAPANGPAPAPPLFPQPYAGRSLERTSSPQLSAAVA